MNPFRHVAVAASLMFLLSTVPLVAQQPTPEVPDRIAAILHEVTVDRLVVVEVEGLTILRGNVRTEAEQALIRERISATGNSDVVSVMQVVPGPDDVELARRAERMIGLARGLRGARLSVSSSGGVVTLEGTVRNASQANQAADLVRSIDGVLGVRVVLSRS